MKHLGDITKISGYGSIYSYESHNGAREMKEDILDILDAFEESEN